MPSSRDAEQKSFSIRAKEESSYSTHRPAHFLAAQRRAGNFKLCDVVLSVEGHEEHVHSVILAVHSQRFHRVMAEQSPPFVLDLPQLSATSLRSVVDWMYFGETAFSTRAIAAHLAVAAYFEISELHRVLERNVIRLARSDATLELAVGAAADPLAKVSQATSALVLDALLAARPSHVLPKMTVPIAKWLLGAETDDTKKIHGIQLVLQWLAIGSNSANANVLTATRIGGLPSDMTEYLIQEMIKMAGRGLPVVITRNPDGRIELAFKMSGSETARSVTERISSSGHSAPSRSRSKHGLVSQIEGPVSDALRSSVEACGNIAYSPLDNVAREIQLLPNPFTDEGTRSTTPRRRRQAQNVDMIIELSTTSVPAFKSFVLAGTRSRARTPIGRNTVSSRSSNNDSNISAHPFMMTAESLAEMHAIPEQFAPMPVEQDARGREGYYQQSAPYYAQQSMQQGVNGAYGYSVPLQQAVQASVQGELPAGTRIIPVASHPMLPNGQPWVEIHVPNPAGASQYAYQSAYADSSLGHSQYAGQF